MSRSRAVIFSCSEARSMGSGFGAALPSRLVMRSSIGTSSAGERRVENAGDIQRLALRAVLDLMTAARAVGDDQCVGRRGAHRGQQRQLAHLQRSEEHPSELQSIMRNSYAVL